jgi:amino acid adenylation domain-containing protein/FkbH-like protein
MMPRKWRRRLESLSQREGASCSMVLLSGLMVLLSRYTRQDDIVVAVAAPGGAPADWIVVRADLAGDPTFRKTLKSVKESAAGAARHGEVTFSGLLERLRTAGNQDPPRSLRQVRFLCETEPQVQTPGLESAGLPRGRATIAPETADFELSFHVAEVADGGLGVRIDYAAELFEPDTIRRLLAHWETLLRGILSGPGRRVSELPLVPPEEQHRLLVEWNDTAKDYPREKRIIELFEAQVARAPDAEALVCGHTRLTYGELDARATRLAGRLRALGVGNETLTGVCLERSWEMVAGILGVLRAGGAYVPLDPAYPRERLAFMLQDSNACVLLVRRNLRHLIPGTGAKVLCIDDDSEAPAGGEASCETRHPGARESSILNSHSSPLAYVIYTSGSTGQPKGVAVEQRSVVALVNWARDRFGPEALSGVLASTSICFDVSVFELFAPLCTGGKVILAENALALPTLPAANEVRFILTVPSAIRELIRMRAVPQSVRVAGLAGEPLTASLADQIYAETTVGQVFDLYGPTETTVYSACALREPGGPAVIGRPLPNEQVYLLDSQRQLVPIGVPGELHIGGDGVARGYLHQPELTAERFIPNPFKPGRLYRTGDLARWRADGALEFLGRIDQQLKIRGFRIEPGEIEAVLKTHPAVREAVVVAREDQPGDRCLVAYVATEPPHSGDAGIEEELRRACIAKLPSYMVPSAVVALEGLPRTPSGKVDRKALPAPPPNRTARGEFVAPRTPTEERLAAIWREVLKIEPIGVQDNFFALGGHSLLAIRVNSRIREVFEVEMPPTGLFDAPTIAVLAEGLAAQRWKGADAAALPLRRLPRKGRSPASFVQERLWFLDKLEPGSDAYNVPLALRLKGNLDVAALRRAGNEIVRRHEALRTTLRMAEAELVQVIAPAAELPLEVSDLAASERTEPDVERRQSSTPEDPSRILDWAGEQARRPFDLARGPLVRAALGRLGPSDHVLVMVMHHAVSDGWSLGILLKELEALYTRFAQEAGAQPIMGSVAGGLPELAVQYADYAHWQRQWMRGQTLEEELAYWKGALAGAPDAIDLPADRNERDGRGGAAVGLAGLTPDLGRSLDEFCRREGVTPFIALMSALAVTLGKWTGQEDLVIGTVVAGRRRPEVDQVIGCFMNFLPIRARLGGVASGEEALQRVRAAVVEAQAHQDCPFERLVEAINPQRRLNQNPLYNVALVFQDFPSKPLHCPGLEASLVPVSMSQPLLDLRFEAEQTADALCLKCEYRSDLFEARTIEQLLASVLGVLTKLVREPQAGGQEFQLTPALASQAEAARARSREQQVVISATFTAEPVAEALAYWFKELELPAKVEFAPYNQVFQQLLDPGSRLSASPGGLNVLLLRLEDWEKPGRAGQGGGADSGTVDRTLEEFVLALKTAAGRGSTPYLVCVCPPSPAVAADGQRKQLAARREAFLGTQLEALAGVYWVSSGELGHLYPVADYYDSSGDELGHVPYTPVFFTALATLIARKLTALNRPPYKVIALDCDQTLWSGVCGEDGAGGIRLEPWRVALQQFMVGQHDAGMLLCLCSKNNEEDVEDVFARRAEMALRREHLAGWRLNWQAKSENLKALAKELGLGLESFIFVDDNPVECAEVQANCPEVLTLHLPEEPARIPDFLRHCWVFDHLKLTEEDRRRARMYRQNRERQGLQEQSWSLAEFLSGLELKIRMEPMSPQQLGRVSQLTHRTNQFNFTTRRRSESEVQGLIGEHQVLTVSVSDRFGDYGLVGVVIYRVRGEALEVDTFLLSCRVLGRGVEHRMLARLGEKARESQARWVNANYLKSPKNKPALDFLESVGAAFKQPLDGGYVFRFPAGFAEEVAFNPPAESSAGAVAPMAESKNEPAALKLQSAPVWRFTRWREIALEAQEPARIHQRVESGAVAHINRRGEYVAPRTEIERKLCEIWQSLLHVDRVGVQDNFFELGGHSLLAVQAHSRMREAFHAEVPLSTLFEAPSIAALAQGLAAGRWQGDTASVLPLVRLPRGGDLPASFVQERLWFLDQLNPGSVAYNVALALRLEGELKIDLLERACNQVIARHEALRTTLRYAEGKLRQVIAPELKLKLLVTDLTASRSAGPGVEPTGGPPLAAPASTPASDVSRLDWLQAQARQPFDLTHGPLVRAGLARLDERHHLFVVVMHHTVSDGWSMGLFLNEVETLYSRLAEPAASNAGDVPELPIQYADFAHWQRRQIQGPMLQRQLIYWKEALSGAPAAVDLPTDRAEPKEPSRHTGSHAVRFPDALARNLADGVQREGTTPFMVMMTALAITLAKWTGQEDLVIGTVEAGRTRPEIENVIGCFMNFLPIRARLAGAASGRELLGRIRGAVVEGKTHQDCPFEKIVEAINPHRGLRRNPLYNVALLLQNFPGSAFRSEKLRASPIPFSLGEALLDLWFEAEQTPDGLWLRCDYRTDLFDAATVGHLVASYQEVLGKLVREPGAALGEFRITYGLAAQAAAARAPLAEETVALSATFTAEPVAEGLRYWIKKMELPAKVEFAPYNQVFQQLLDPGSLLSKNGRGLNVVLLRLEDWQPAAGARERTGPGESALERNAREFIQAIQAASSRLPTRWLICVCPASPAALANSGRARLLARVEGSLENQLHHPGRIDWISGRELARRYAVAEYSDASSDDLGHVPYTPLFFTALATAIARHLAGLERGSASVALVHSDYQSLVPESGDLRGIHEQIGARSDSGPARRAEYVPPRTDMERRLCELWRDLLRVDRVGVRDDFFDLDGHSLLAVRLFAEVERTTGRKYPLVTIFQAPTIEQLARVLDGHGQAAHSGSLLVPIQPRGAGPPLFLIHGAGGDVLWGYANLAAHLGTDQPIYGIKSRGQIGLDEPRSVREMAACYLREVRQLQPRGPYYLGGYCFGGNVAYEMARQLEQLGETVALVVLLDSAPSNAGYERVTWWRPGFAFRFARNVGYWLSDFFGLGAEERRRFIRRKTRSLGRKVKRWFCRETAGSDLDVEEIVDPIYFPESELKLWGIHLRALAEHTEGQYPGRITLLRTRGQPLLCSFDEDFCWGGLALGGVKVKRIPGSHENVFTEPNVRYLARAIEECLAQAQAENHNPRPNPH